MKNKGLIIGGVAIVALGAFWWMRKKNQMAEESGATTSDSKSDTPTGGSTSTGGTTSTGGAGSTPPIGSAINPTPAVNVVPMALTFKAINNAVDLQGTKLGSDIGLTNASPTTLANVTNAFVRLN